MRDEIPFFSRDNVKELIDQLDDPANGDSAFIQLASAVFDTAAKDLTVDSTPMTIVMIRDSENTVCIDENILRNNTIGDFPGGLEKDDLAKLFKLAVEDFSANYVFMISEAYCAKIDKDQLLDSDSALQQLRNGEIAVRDLPPHLRQEHINVTASSRSGKSLMLSKEIIHGPDNTHTFGPLLANGTEVENLSDIKLEDSPVSGRFGGIFEKPEMIVDNSHLGIVINPDISKESWNY